MSQAQSARGTPHVTIAQSRLVPEFGSTKKRILIINARSHMYAPVGTLATLAPTTPGGGAAITTASGGSGGATARDSSSGNDTALFTRQLFELDDLRNASLPEFRVRHLNDVKLSADQRNSTWSELAHLIEDEYDNYDGFVVEHGKDTMVYTATALSFMLENLGKPIMFTGSVIPGNLVQSDIKSNIILAMLFAQNEDICEVCIVFAEHLFRANRTFKIATSMMQPFVSPNMVPLATLRGNRVVLEHRLLNEAPKGRLRIHTDMSAVILTIKLIPGMSFDMATKLVATTHARAIIICGFGSGNVPVRRGVMLSMVAGAIERGVLVVVCTQNRFGVVDLGSYDTARQLMAVGAIGTADMTMEATIVKLKYLFGRGLDAIGVRHFLLQSLRGETSATALAKL